MQSTTLKVVGIPSDFFHKHGSQNVLDPRDRNNIKLTVLYIGSENRGKCDIDDREICYVSSSIL